MSKSIRWLWSIASIFAIICVGCDSAPPTDETDPLPKVFDNKDIDRSKMMGPGSGTGMGGGMGRGGGGGMGMGQGGGGRHSKGGRDGTGGGTMDGTGGGEQKAKTKKAPEKKEGPDEEQP